MSPHSDSDGNASSFISSNSVLSQEHIHRNQLHHNSHLHSHQKHHNSRYHHLQYTQNHNNHKNGYSNSIHSQLPCHNFNHNVASTNPNNIVKYLIASEFDINLGPVIRQQYPSPIPSDNLPYFAELLMPDQIHTRPEDWTVVILHKDKHSGEYQYGSSTGSVTHSNSSTDSLTTMASTLYTHTKEKGNNDQDKEQCQENGNGEEDQNDNDQPLYILNVVNTRFNQNVHRNTIIKGIAIATTSHYFQMFKPLLLVALDQLFHITTTTASTLNPTPNNTYDDAYIPVLRNLYESINAIDIHGIVPRFSLERKLLLNSIVDFPIKECFSNKKFATKMFESAINSEINYKGYAKKELIQHMKIKDNATIEVLVNYLNFKIPLRVPFLQMPEIVGDFSVRDLVSNLLYAKVVINKGKANQTKNSTIENDNKDDGTKNDNINIQPYSELLVYGESTPAIVVLINAFLTHKKILYLGNKTPASAICEAVFATIALISGGGGLLRGFLKQTYPYIDLSKFEFIEEQDWYFAGTANPTFKAHERLYDVLYDMELNELVLSGENGYCMQEAITRSRKINISESLMASLNNNSKSINNNNDYGLSSSLAPIESNSPTFSSYANQLDVSEEEENDSLEQVRSPSSITSMPFSNNTTANSGYAFAVASNPFRSVSGQNLTAASSPRIVSNSKSMDESPVVQKPTSTPTPTPNIFSRSRQNSSTSTNNHKNFTNSSNSNINNNAIILEDANLLKKLTILIREKHDDETIIMAFRQHVNEIMRILESVDQLDKQKKSLLLGPCQGLELSDLIGFMLKESLPQLHTIAATSTPMKRQRPSSQSRSFSFEGFSSSSMPSSPIAANGNASRFKSSPLSSPTETPKSFNQHFQHQQSQYQQSQYQQYQYQQSQYQHQNQLRHPSSPSPFNSNFNFSTNNGSSSHGGLKINRNSASSANKNTKSNTNSTYSANTKANNGMHAKNESMNSFASNTTFSSTTNTATNSNSISNSKHSSMTTNDSSVINGYGNYGNGKGFTNYGVISEGDDNDSDSDSYNENNNDNYNNNGQDMMSISANAANANNNTTTAAWKPSLINTKYFDSSIHSNFSNSQHSRQYINNCSHNYNQSHNHNHRQGSNINYLFDNGNNQVGSSKPAISHHSYHNQNNNINSSSSNNNNKRISGGIVGLNLDLNFENGYFWNSKKEKLSEIKTYYWVYKGYKYAPQIVYGKKDDESSKNGHLKEKQVQGQCEAQDHCHFRNPISYFFEDEATANVDLNAVYGNNTYVENDNDDKSADTKAGNASQNSSPCSVKGNKNSNIYNSTRDATNINKTGKSKNIKTVDIAYQLSMLQNSMIPISNTKSLEIYSSILAYLTSASLSTIDSTSSSTLATTSISTEKSLSPAISESSNNSNSNGNGNGNCDSRGINANQKPSASETEAKVEKFLIMTYLLSSNSYSTAAPTTGTANNDNNNIGSNAKNKGIEMICNGLFHRDVRVRQKVVEILNLITRESVLGNFIFKNGINPFFKMAWDEQKRQ